MQLVTGPRMFRKWFKRRACGDHELSGRSILRQAAKLNSSKSVLKSRHRNSLWILVWRCPVKCWLMNGEQLSIKSQNKWEMMLKVKVICFLFLVLVSSLVGGLLSDVWFTPVKRRIHLSSLEVKKASIQILEIFIIWLKKEWKRWASD